MLRIQPLAVALITMTALAVSLGSGVSLNREHHTTDLQERQVSWIRSTWVVDPVAIDAGVDHAEQGVWMAMTKSCQQFSDNSAPQPRP
jgi:hypothetical protein